MALRCVKTQRQANRLLALRALGNGVARETVAAVFQINERTLCGWIRAFNERGIDGLVDAPRPGRTRILSHESFLAQVVPLLEDPAQVAEVHWTGVKLDGYLRKELGLELGYSTLLRQLHQENLDAAHPASLARSPKDDVWEQKRAAFLPKFRSLLEDAQARVSFCDECGIEGDPRPRRQWAPKGSHPTLGYTH